MRYLDSVALAQLRNFRLELRRVAGDGHVTGRHRSAWKGLSHEFAQHRPYVPGDELKALDWKVYARQDRFYVREYQAENILTTHVLLDASGSMAYGEGGGKWDRACRLAMAMAYLILERGDAVGLTVFDTALRERVPPRAALGHLELMDQTLSARAPGGETALATVLEAAAALIKRRSLVVLVSDLLADPQRVLQVVRALKARKHELVVMQVLDPRERDFPFSGPVIFDGLEGGAELFCDASAVASSYREEFDRMLRLYEATFHRSNVSYGAFFTDAPWEAGLPRLLRRWQ